LHPFLENPNKCKAFKGLKGSGLNRKNAFVHRQQNESKEIEGDTAYGKKLLGMGAGISTEALGNSSTGDRYAEWFFG
jgi:hypothetical protein